MTVSLPKIQLEAAAELALPKIQLEAAAELALPMILQDDDPLLRTVSAPVTDFEAVGPLVHVMLDVLIEKNGRGLSAVQIGVPLRVLIVRTRVTGAWEFLFFVNPEITRTLNRQEIEREGCLSVAPSRWGNVRRPAKCDATWFDLGGVQHSATLTGETARIFQHELDHLNGILMTDRIPGA